MDATSSSPNSVLPPVRWALLTYAAALLAVFIGSLLITEGRPSTGAFVLPVLGAVLLGAAIVARRKPALAYWLGGAVAAAGLVAGAASMVMLPLQLAEGTAEVSTMARAATGAASLLFATLLLLRLRRRQRSRGEFGPLTPIAWR
jgi:hypothetical protein